MLSPFLLLLLCYLKMLAGNSKLESEKFRIFPIQILNFPPTFLDSIEEGEHGDNRGTSSLGIQR